MNIRSLWSACSLNPREQLGKTFLKAFGDDVEVPDRDIPSPSLYIRQERPIKTHFFRHFHLGPALLLPQCANAVPKSEQEFIGHGPIIKCYVNTTKRVYATFRLPRLSITVYAVMGSMKVLQG